VVGIPGAHARELGSQPFLVHAAQPNRGTQARFIAQPPLISAAPLELDRADGTYSPVERAVRLGLARQG
jgi:hypothetical protein